MGVRVKPSVVWEEPPSSVSVWDETAHLLRSNPEAWARILTAARTTCRKTALEITDGKDPWLPTGAFEAEYHNIGGGEWGVWARHLLPEHRAKKVAATAATAPAVVTVAADGGPPPPRPLHPKTAKALEEEKEEPLAEYAPTFGDKPLPVPTTPAVEDALLEEGTHPFALAVDRSLRKKQVSRFHRLGHRLGVKVATRAEDGRLLVTVAHSSANSAAR